VTDDDSIAGISLADLKARYREQREDVRRQSEELETLDRTIVRLDERVTAIDRLLRRGLTIATTVVLGVLSAGFAVVLRYVTRLAP
jgi:hypothetical protein